MAFLRHDNLRPKIHVTFDNCPVNKNLFRLHCFKFSFGHTQFGPDTMFGWFSNRVDDADLFEVEGVEELATKDTNQNSYSAHILPCETRSISLIAAVQGITSYHLMRVTREEGDADPSKEAVN